MFKDISAPVRYLKGIGPKRAKLFNRLGINSVEDLFYYFPRRYEDRATITEIARLKAGEYQTIKAHILGFGERASYKRRAFKIFEVVVEDDTGRLLCVWFNQPYLKQYLKAGKQVVLYGKVDVYGSALQIQNPEYEIVDGAQEEDSLNYGRIVPVYSLAKELSQRVFRRIIKAGLDEYVSSLQDIIPFDIRQRHNLLNVASSMLNMHFPQDAASQEKAYKRIIFEECFLLQLLFGLKRLKSNKITGISHKLNHEFLAEFEKSLTFELTSAQKKAVLEIRDDLVSHKPMHRLLQGDVGSGKTIVALYGCLAAVSSGLLVQTGNQAAFMVPTEILAEQHYRSLRSQVSGLKLGGRAINIALLTSSLNKKERGKIYQDVKSGEVDILVGTHALIQKDLEFKHLSFVVIDEQHKFGVHQRLNILTKGVNPDCLIMTATPIPRTLAMTIYADLDISTIDELPKGRVPVKTYLVDENRRQWVEGFIRKNLKSGRQAYVVYPIIEESETLDLKAAKTMYEDLSRNVFADYNVALIHSRIKGSERNSIMQAFQEGEIDLLVSTVLVEVGIDVPNACVMVIEHAERFGLSQLHQLRGRIGRGGYESHCILISNVTTAEAKLRLKAMVMVSDGFKIAQADLEIRGPGEFFGARQHGIPELRVNPLENLELLTLAKEEAGSLLQKDPVLILRQNQGLGNALKSRFPDYDKLMQM